MGCLQLVLDKGQEEDWFASHWITALFVVATVDDCVGSTGNGGIKIRSSICTFLRNRNFAVAMLITFVLGVVLFSTTVLIPQFLQELLG